MKKNTNSNWTWDNKYTTIIFKSNFKTDAKIFEYANTFNKHKVLIFWHFFVAFLLGFGLYLIFAYGYLVSELSTQGLFFLWQILGGYVLPTAILFLSLFVVLLPNPIYALICLILVFFSAAVFLLSINVNFLAMIYLIIYIGAIAILFLFVIMMFDLRELQQKATHLNDYSFLSVSFSFCVFAVYKFYVLLLDNLVTFVNYDNYFNTFAKTKLESLRYFLTYQHTDILLFGTLLYDYYSYLFLVSGLILLTSMLGSIILALSTTEKTAELSSRTSMSRVK